MKSLENLYGSTQVQPEARLAAKTLIKVATIDTCHPADREKWTPKNPTLGHCDVSSELCKLMWGANVDGNLSPKWNPEGRFFTWWVYEDYQHFLAGIKRNKIDVHHDFFHPKYLEIDLTKNQFPDKIYLHPRPKPLSHKRPLTRSWHRDSEVPQRLEILLGVFVPAFLDLINKEQINPTPELEWFLENISQ